MIGLDTNILVRYLTQDDPTQAALANRLVEETLTAERPGFVSSVALVELVWVLEGAYGCERVAVAAILEGILRAKTLVVEAPEIAWHAARQYASGKADFADCVIARAGLVAGCESTVTFDRSAAKDAGMHLLRS